MVEDLRQLAEKLGFKHYPAIFKRELLQNAQQQENSQYMLLFRTPQAEAAIQLTTTN